MAPKPDKGKAKVGEGSGKKKAAPFRPWHAPEGFTIRLQKDKNNYDKLVHRPIKNTRYMDITAMEKLGIYDDCRWLLNGIGWYDFMNLQHHTYEELTLEFLSTFQWLETGEVMFQLRNQRSKLPLAVFMRHLHSPMDGVSDIDDCPNYIAADFWRAITGDEEYYPRNAKASRIQHPAFRYLHRVLAHTIFARGDSDGNVRTEELWFLWAMTARQRVNVAPFLLRHLKDSQQKLAGDICIGGFATSLAVALEIDLSGLTEAQGPLKDDLAVCAAMRMVRKHGARYQLTIKGNVRSIHLPHPNISVQDPTHWLVEHIADIPVNEEQGVESDPEQEQFMHDYGEQQQQYHGGAYWEQPQYDQVNYDEDFYNINVILRAQEDELRAQGQTLNAFGTELQGQRELLENIQITQLTQGQMIVNQGQQLNRIEQMMQELRNMQFPPPPPPPPY